MNKQKRMLKKSKVQIFALCIFVLSLGVSAFLIISGKHGGQRTHRENTGEVIPSKEVASELILETEMIPAEEKSQEELLSEKVEQKISEMTVEEKVAQLFMITPEALTGYSSVTAASTVTEEALRECPVGGLIMFSGNIVDPKQLTEMTGNLQSYSLEISGMPMFLAVDEEGGSVARIAKNSNFDVEKITDMREIGATKDCSQAYEAGRQIGSYLKEYGFNLDLAPVADVITNPQNQLLKDRSFGGDATMVSEMDQAFLQGLHENEVYGCLKHFPGHGGTSGDTHDGYAYTDRTLEELKSEELVPFQEGIDNGISFIMVAHITASGITDDHTPASLSSEIITELLRNQMGYDGIVITDALNMSAITNEYDSAAAAVKAIQAGADIVLMPQNFEKAYQGVLDAVASGTISEERLNESIKRILRIKLEMEG